MVLIPTTHMWNTRSACPCLCPHSWDRMPMESCQRKPAFEGALYTTWFKSLGWPEERPGQVRNSTRLEAAQGARSSWLKPLLHNQSATQHSVFVMLSLHCRGHTMWQTLLTMHQCLFFFFLKNPLGFSWIHGDPARDNISQTSLQLVVIWLSSGQWAVIGSNMGNPTLTFLSPLAHALNHWCGGEPAFLMQWRHPSGWQKTQGDLVGQATHLLDCLPAQIVLREKNQSHKLLKWSLFHFC